MKNTKTLFINKTEALIRYFLDSKGYKDYQYHNDVHYNNMLEENFTMLDLTRHFGSLSKEAQEKVTNIITEQINLEKADLYFTIELLKYLYTTSIYAKK